METVKQNELVVKLDCDQDQVKFQLSIQDCFQYEQYQYDELCDTFSDDEFAVEFVCIDEQDCEQDDICCYYNNMDCVGGDEYTSSTNGFGQFASSITFLSILYYAKIFSFSSLQLDFTPSTTLFLSNSVLSASILYLCSTWTLFALVFQTYSPLFFIQKQCEIGGVSDSCAEGSILVTKRYAGECADEKEDSECIAGDFGLICCCQYNDDVYDAYDGNACGDANVSLNVDDHVYDVNAYVYGGESDEIRAAEEGGDKEGVEQDKGKVDVRGDEGDGLTEEQLGDDNGECVAWKLTNCDDEFDVYDMGDFCCCCVGYCWLDYYCCCCAYQFFLFDYYLTADIGIQDVADLRMKKMKVQTMKMTNMKKVNIMQKLMILIVIQLRSYPITPKNVELGDDVWDMLGDDDDDEKGEFDTDGESDYGIYCIYTRPLSICKELDIELESKVGELVGLKPGDWLSEGDCADKDGVQPDEDGDTGVIDDVYECVVSLWDECVDLDEKDCLFLRSSNGVLPDMKADVDIPEKGDVDCCVMGIDGLDVCYIGSGDCDNVSCLVDGDKPQYRSGDEDSCGYFKLVIVNMKHTLVKLVGTLIVEVMDELMDVLIMICDCQQSQDSYIQVNDCSPPFQIASGDCILLAYETFADNYDYENRCYVTVGEYEVGVPNCGDLNGVGEFCFCEKSIGLSYCQNCLYYC
ncbi:MAG: hypothetical protein EZS28_012875 [Streblomastix strix]|uniref:Uncharacterized protein n=1 Tax=Streblomastix strix TaxID=222440 RepID=A0A5J4W9K0_9EUKA|nr:MAG: hypothetical protein EZS28_012875 [Streblomastix strix]